MKKFFLFFACASLFVMGAKAQDSKSLFNEAQKAYNAYFVKAQTGDLDDEAAANLQNSFNLYTQALACDTTYETNKDGTPKVDKKTGVQKYKTKVSGDIVKAFTNMINNNDFLRVGEYYRGKEDFHNAAIAYALSADLLQSKFAQEAPDNATLSEILFLQGFANFFDKNYKDCFINMVNAKELGYTSNNIDAYISDVPSMIVQDYVNANNYAAADEALDYMIAKVPSVSSLYSLKARVVEFENGFDAAIPAYETALAKDPNSAFTNYCLGYGYYGIVENAINNSNAMSDAAVAKEVAHLLDKPIEYLNKAITLNNNISSDMLEDAQKKLERLQLIKSFVK
ncbi:MAG: hypothetical protein IKW83_00640 [Muribaculaceae bacterium]|nr:hypothetical protein [Muribaculaceae bacterium]